jgi:hypothetical protein
MSRRSVAWAWFLKKSPNDRHFVDFTVAVQMLGQIFPSDGAGFAIRYEL